MDLSKECLRMVVELTFRKFYVQLMCAAKKESQNLKSELILFSHKNGDKNIKKTNNNFMDDV